MNKKLSKLFYRGMWHRKKEVAGVCIATMLASFFITCILLFQENMYQWQVAENFMRFGSWFVMQSSGEPYNTLKDSIYLDEPVEAGVYGTIYNRNWDKARGCIGYMTPEFMEQANIELDKGRLPENENEIACDWTTLAKLGYNGQLGQEIVIKYYQNDNKSREDPERQAVYTLCGVFGDYSDVWEYGKYIPCGVITKEACEQLDSKESKVWLYSLKNTVRNKDYNSIYNELQGNITSKIFYNTSVYDFEAWGPKDIYNYIDNNISMNEIKIISNKNRIKFSIRERLEYSFVTDISLEQQIQNFSDKSNEYLNIVNKILENRKNAIEVYNDEKSTEEELLYICSKLFLNELSDEQITLYKESIIGIAINSDVNDEYYSAFLLLYNKLYNKYFAVRSGKKNGKEVYCKTPNMLIAAAFYEANGYTLESFDEDIITYMKLLRDIQPETDFIKGLFGWLGFEKKQMLMDYIIMSDDK